MIYTLTFIRLKFQQVEFLVGIVLLTLAILWWGGFASRKLIRRWCREQGFELLDWRGARFFEGAAAGCVMVGSSPQSPAFGPLFDWPDAVTETQPNGRDIATILSQLSSQPERLKEIGRRNAYEALLRHDWSHRWKQILSIVGLKPSPAVELRERHLIQLAKIAKQED